MRRQRSEVGLGPIGELHLSPGLHWSQGEGVWPLARAR